MTSHSQIHQCPIKDQYLLVAITIQVCMKLQEVIKSTNISNVYPENFFSCGQSNKKLHNTNSNK